MHLHGICIPKRPTLRAREAEKKLLLLLGDKKWDSSAPLPTVRSLGEQWGVNYATISRLFQRLVREGLVWQHPNGRFFPAHAGSQAAEGLPVGVSIAAPPFDDELVLDIMRLLENKYKWHFAC